MTLINKKDENIIYNIDYINKNLDIEKLLFLLEKKCFADWYFNSSADSNVEKYNIDRCAIESCINEKNDDPNIKDKGIFPDEEMSELGKLEWFFCPEEYHTENNVIEVKEKYEKEYKEYEKLLEHHNNEGTFLEAISSNFKLSYYRVQVAETLKEFKEKKFEIHSIIHSKMNNKYYYIFNNPGDNQNLIVKIYDKLISECEFIEIIINKFGEDAIITNDGNTLGDLYEKVL